MKIATPAAPKSPFHPPLLGLALAGLAAMSLSACSSIQSPTTADSVDVQWVDQDPTRSTPQATIELGKDGFWTYEAYQRDRFSGDLDKGDLAVLEASEHSYIFAVVEPLRDGYRLQRLDDQPVSNRVGGHFRPLDKDLAMSQDDLCLVDDAQTFDAQCPPTHHHQRWSLYPLATDPGHGLTIERDVLAGEDDTLGLPYIATAHIFTDPLDTHSVALTEGFNGHGPSLAMRHHRRTTHPRRAHIRYDDQCFEPTADVPFIDQSPLGNDERPSLQDLDHPLRIEAAALATGADALVLCDDQEVLLFTPSLTRPLLVGDRERVISPSSLGKTGRPISDHATQQWALYAASLATGDFTLATQLLLPILHTDDLPSEQRALVLSAMTQLATQGRPEWTLRVGDRLTRRAWNASNIPDYLDGLIAVFSQLDQHDQRSELIQHRQRSSSRHFHAQRRAWYQWAEARMRIAQQRDSFGTTYGQIIDGLQESGHDDWALAVWLNLKMAQITLPIVDDASALDHRFQSAGANDLWRALRSTAEFDGDAPRRPTTYGWASSTDDVSPEELPGLLFDAPAGIFPAGFKLVSPEDMSPMAQLALAPLLPSSQQQEVAQGALRSMTHQDFCADLPHWQTRFERTAHRLEAHALSDRRPGVRLFHWWANQGLHSYCDGPEPFLSALEDVGSSASSDVVALLPFLEHQILEHPDADRGELFSRAAHLARGSGDRSSCLNWSLATALGAAQQGDFQHVESMLILASDCLEDSAEARARRDLISAYAQFERGGGHSLQRDGQIAQAIRRATGQRIDDPNQCIGTIPIGFRLFDHLPDDITRVADAIDASEPVDPDDLSLQTASAYLEQGLAHYRSGRRDLQRGRLVTAAHALDEARDYFHRIDHLPALRRIAFLDSLVFNEQMSDVVAASKEDVEIAIDEIDDFSLQGDDSPIGRIQRGQAHRVINEEAPLDILAASLLIAGRETTLDDHLDGRDLEAELPDLCLPPSWD